MRKFVVIICLGLLIGTISCSGGGFKFGGIDELCQTAELLCMIVDTVMVEVPIETVEYVVEVDTECIIAGEFPPVYFESNSSQLQSQYYPVLIAIGNTLANCPEMDIIIEGHCDERRSNEYNQELGLKRARAVMDWLINFGVEDWRISTISYGEKTPFTTGYQEDFWRLNRRVETKIK